MSTNDHTPEKDITSLTAELVNLSFDDVGAEELERRLELTIALLPILQNSTCGTDQCNGFSDSGSCPQINGCHGFS